MEEKKKRCFYLNCRSVPQITLSIGEVKFEYCEKCFKRLEKSAVETICGNKLLDILRTHTSKESHYHTP